MRLPCLVSLAATVLAVGTASAEDFPNPEFASWSKFKKGTSITIKTTTVAAGMTSEITTTTTLVEVGADKLVLTESSVTKAAGMEFKTDPEKRDVPKTVKLPDGVKKPDPKAKVEKPAGTFEDGTETLKVAGTEVKTKWYKSKVEIAGNKTESKIWMSDDVPGGTVKMEATTTGMVAATIKTELVEFKKP